MSENASMPKALKLSSPQRAVLRAAKAGDVYRSERGRDLYTSYDRAQNNKKVTSIVDRLATAGLLRIGEQAGMQRPWFITDAGEQVLAASDMNGGGSHARRKLAKKTAAQLSRDINEALGRRVETRARGSRTVHHATRSGLKLSDNQKTMLRMALDTGRMSSGRYGWNEMHVRSLEKKGLVRLVSRATWDKEWKLTDLGRETAKVLHAEWLEQVR